MRHGDRLRCFVAAPIEVKVAKRLVREIGFLQLAGADVKWVPLENLHVTLRFIGNTDPNDVVPVVDAIEEVAAEIPACRPMVEGIEFFPNQRRPRVVAARVTEDVEALNALYAGLQKTLGELGFRPERKPLRPHVTLGRMNSGGRGMDDLMTRLEESAERRFGPTVINHVNLYMSETGPQGPEYTIMNRIELLG